MPLLLGQLKRTTWLIASPSQKLLALVAALVLALSAFVFVSREVHAQDFQEQPHKHTPVQAKGTPNIDGIGEANATVPMMSGMLPTQPLMTGEVPLVVIPPTKVSLTSVTSSLIETPTKETSQTTETPPSMLRVSAPTETPMTERFPQAETYPTSENNPQITDGTPPQTSLGGPPSIETSPLLEISPMRSPIIPGMPQPMTASPVIGSTPGQAPELPDQNDSQFKPGEPYDGYEPSAGAGGQPQSPVYPHATAYQYAPWTHDVSPAFDQTFKVDSRLVPAPAPASYQAVSVDPRIDPRLAPAPQSDHPDTLPMLQSTPQEDWEPDFRGGSSILNKPPLPVVGCNLCAKILRAIDSALTLPHPSLMPDSDAKLFSFDGNQSLLVLQEVESPLPLQTSVRSAPPLGDKHTNAVPTEPLSEPLSYGADPEPLDSVTTVPGVTNEKLLPFAPFEAQISEAVGTVRSVDTSLDANLAGLVSDRSAETSSVTKPDDAGETPAQQPHSPSTPGPVENSFLSLSGGGQIGAGGVVSLLFLGALAFSLFSLPRDGRLSKVFCEVPKLCSALLLPLERPG
jgi:hypothetical protein